MAPLAERGQVPPLQVELVTVQMVNGQREAVSSIMGMSAPFAFPLGPLLDQEGDLWPVRRVFPRFCALDHLDGG